MKPPTILVLLGLFLAPLTGDADGFEDTGFEIGFELLTPGGLNLSLGYWGPVYARVSGGKLPKIEVDALSFLPSLTMSGYQAEFGWAFDRDGFGWQALSLGYVNTKMGTDSWKGFGPFYTLNFNGFTLQGGYTFGKGDGGFISAGPGQLMLQFGWGMMFGRPAPIPLESQ